MSKNNPLESILSAGSSVRDYQNIINQPTMTDSIADAFISQGQGNTLNQKQRYTKAAMLGLGHGLKGAANSERANKLSSLETAAKQIAELDMSLKTSLGKKLSREAMLANVASENYVDLKKINEMYGVGDYQGLNELVPAVYNSIARKYPEIASQTGTFSHVYGNNIYFNKDGKEYGLNVKDAFEPFVNILPEENQRELQNLLSRTAKNKFTNSDIIASLEIEGKRADVNLKQAHAGVYQQQANQIQNEIANPPKEKGTIDPQKMSEDLDVISKQIETIGEKGEQKGFSRVMSEITPGHTWQLTPEQTQIDTLGQLLRGQMFKAFGYRNETEFEQIPTISSNNSVKQNQSIIQQYKNLYLKDQQPQNDMIQVISPSGKVGMIPKSSLQAAKEKGFKLE